MSENKCALNSYNSWNTSILDDSWARKERATENLTWNRALNCNNKKKIITRGTKILLGLFSKRHSLTSFMLYLANALQGQWEWGTNFCWRYSSFNSAGLVNFDLFLWLNFKCTNLSDDVIVFINLLNHDLLTTIDEFTASTTCWWCEEPCSVIIEDGTSIVSDISSL